MKIKKLHLILSVWLVSFVFWFVYRYFIHTSEWIDEIIFKPLIFITPVLVYLKHKEHVSFDKLGLRLVPLNKLFGWGFGLGSVLVLESLIIDVTKNKHLNVEFFSATAVATNLFISLATAFSEEILYRGFLMQQFTKWLKNIYAANCISALLFCIGHVPIGIFVLHFSTWELISYLLLVFILGVFDGYVYQKTNTVYSPIIVHTLWNFSNTLFV